jgi:hypothetical protein
MLRIESPDGRTALPTREGGNHFWAGRAMWSFVVRLDFVDIYIN